jgi:hypothetical protein
MASGWTGASHSNPSDWLISSKYARLANGCEILNGDDWSIFGEVWNSLIWLADLFNTASGWTGASHSNPSDWLISHEKLKMPNHNLRFYDPWLAYLQYFITKRWGCCSRCPIIFNEYPALIGLSSLFYNEKMGMLLKMPNHIQWISGADWPIFYIY